MTYEVLLTIRAPVSWCLGTPVDGVCEDVDGFSGLGGTQGFESADSCLDTIVLIASFGFSIELVCGLSGPLEDW